MSYLSSTRGVSLKKTEKNKTINVPISKKVYTNASIFDPLLNIYLCFLTKI